MKPRTPSLHPLLILFAVALVSVLFVVSCGDGGVATATPASGAAEAAAAEAAATEAAELAAAAEVAAAEAAELAAAAEAAEAAAAQAEEAEAAAAQAAAAEAAAEAEAAAAQAAAAEAAAEAAAAEAAAAEAAAEEAALPGAPKRGGTLTLAMVADGVTLDPPITLSAVDQAITQATYDNLLMFQPDGSVKPELAVSWEANDDLSSFTFKLRQGVKFHHGKDFSAEDVLWTFNRLLDPVLDSPIRPTFAKAIDEMVIIDDYTIRFDLVGPNGFFLDALSLHQVRIMPSDADVSRMTLEEFGTGPFMIEEYLPLERTTMVRNPDYWDEGKPYLDEYVILNIHEAATRAEALKSGDVDVIFDLEFGSVASIESHPDTVVLETAGTAWIGMPMRNDVEPFDNILVRKAMQAATDRESIWQAALFGRGAIAYDHPVPPSSSLYAPQHQAPDYNPELAKQLLAEAGYPDGIDITLHTADIGSGMIEMAVAFKEGAAPAGIRVDVHRNPSDGYWSNVWNHDHPFTVVWWAGRPNPDLALSIQYQGSRNASHYFNDEFDALILRARAEIPEDQKVSYERIQEILIDEVPMLVVAFKPMLYGARNNVRGVTPHFLGATAIILQDGWIDD